MNRLAPVMIDRMTTSVVAERTPGTVMFMKDPNLPAPSIEADS